MAPSSRAVAESCGWKEWDWDGFPASSLNPSPGTPFSSTLHRFVFCPLYPFMISHLFHSPTYSNQTSPLAREELCSLADSCALTSHHCERRGMAYLAGPGGRPRCQCSAPPSALDSWLCKLGLWKRGRGVLVCGPLLLGMVDAMPREKGSTSLPSFQLLSLMHHPGWTLSPYLTSSALLLGPSLHPLGSLPSFPHFFSFCPQLWKQRMPMAWAPWGYHPPVW